MRKFFRRVLLLLGVLLTAVISAAQINVAELSAQATSAKYPDARNVLLYDAEHMVCQKDGTSVSTDEFYYKVLTEAGRKELLSIPLHCNTNYGSAAFLACAVLRGGKRIDIDIAKHTITATSSDQMSSNIYEPEMKVTTLTVPQLEVGDILYIKTERRTVKPIIPGEWSNIISLESDVPILHYDVTIDMPSEMPLAHSVIKSEVKGTVKTFPAEKKGNRIIYKWQARNVPQAIPESDMPALYTCCQRLLVGTSRSWQDISKWYYSLCRPRMDAVSDEMRKQVAELVKGANDDDDKMRRIFRYVSQNIRYAGVTAEKTAPGFEPHDVKDTFKQKHGVCRDKAALLVSMLELAGFKAYPVLFMSGTPKDFDVPNGYFNHAVVCVDRGNFDYVLMDPTDENTRTLFPEYLSNQSYLAARPEGDILRRSPIIPAERNKMKITTTSAVDGQGVLVGNSRVELYGMSDLIYRSSFSRMTPAKRLEFWQGRVRNALPGAEVQSLEITPENIRDTSQQVVINFSFKTENALPATRSTAVLTVPKFGAQFGVLNWLLPETSLENRRFPIECDSTCSFEEESVLKLPPQLEMCGVPAPQSGKNRHFSWSSKYDFADHTLKYVGKSSLDSVEISEKDYPAFRNELNNCFSSADKLPVVKKNYVGFSAEQYRKMFPDADAVLLESDEQLKLDGKCTYTSVKRRKIMVLNYAGVKRYSELKEFYFPSRESVSVTASVKQPDNSSAELEKHHIKEMDAPWTSDLKHVPPAKIKVCALPGVAVNSVVEYTVVRKANSLFPAAGCAVVQGHLPILKWSFTIDAPEKLKLYTSEVPAGVKFERESRQKRMIRTWRAANLAGLKREYSQSELRFFAPHISYSAGNAKEFSAKFRKLLEEKVKGECSRVAEACFENMDQTSTLTKSSHIRDFVVRSVRVAGPFVNEVPFTVWRTPDAVYASSVATGIERALLMASLFEKAGINYRFHLASSKPFHAQVYRSSFCFEPDFDTVLLYVPELNAYFNCSEEYAQIGYTSYCGKLGINLSNARMSAITSASDALNRISKDFTVKIRSNGSAVINVVEQFSGKYYEDIKRKLKEMTPELRSRYFSAKAQSLRATAKLNGKYSYEFSDKKAVVKYSVLVPDFAGFSGDYLTYELPGHYILRSKAAVYGTQRTTPFVRDVPEEISLDWRIFAPAGYSHYVSGIRNTEAGLSQFAKLIDRRRSTEREANISIRLSLPVAFVEPADFDQLISVQNALGISKSRFGMMKKKTR